MAFAGKIELYAEDGSSVWASLYNYSIGAAFLKPQHKSWLDAHVVAKFKGKPVNIAIWGFSSRSGDYSWNQLVARRRAEAVYFYLSARGFPESAFKWLDAQVDDNSADDPNDETWRSATLLLSKDPFYWVDE